VGIWCAEEREEGRREEKKMREWINGWGKKKIKIDESE
jgi:hypothetical protein